jgi:hypothetical protein
MLLLQVFVLEAAPPASATNESRLCSWQYITGSSALSAIMVLPPSGKFLHGICSAGWSLAALQVWFRVIGRESS